MTSDNISFELNGVTNVELLYTNPLGELKAIDVHPERYRGAVTKGKNVDGSSVNYVPVENSDIKLVLLEGTQRRCPWDPRTLQIYCDVMRGDGELKEMDGNPRYILRKHIENAKYGMKSSAEMEGFAFWGVPEGEKLKDMNPVTRNRDLQNHVIDRLIEVRDTAGPDDKFKVLKEILISPRGRYGSPSPADGTKYIRQSIYEMLDKLGWKWEYSHPEVGLDQIEFSMKYDDSLSMVDKIMQARRMIQDYALQHGVVLSFMPKILTDKIAGVNPNGSGCHAHASLWEGGRNIFFDKGMPHNFSQEGVYAVGGILEHMPALVSLSAWTPHSPKRLQPHVEAPTNISWGYANRTTPVRIPNFREPEEARIEFRPRDDFANFYGTDALLHAAMEEGIAQKIKPPEPESRNVWDHDEEFESIPGTPGGLLDALGNDRLFHEVFGPAAGHYLELRQKEIELFERNTGPWDPKHVTDWEFERYLVYV